MTIQDIVNRLHQLSTLQYEESVEDSCSGDYSQNPDYSHPDVMRANNISCIIEEAAREIIRKHSSPSWREL